MGAADQASQPGTKTGTSDQANQIQPGTKMGSGDQANHQPGLSLCRGVPFAIMSLQTRNVGSILFFLPEDVGKIAVTFVWNCNPISYSIQSCEIRRLYLQSYVVVLHCFTEMQRLFYN